jgi:uncharacterized membrane-anchored protein YitT (DUF2179 family)
MKKYTKREILFSLKNILQVILGTIILAFGTGVFIVPFDLITGGMAGAAIILEKILPFNLSVDIYVTILTWVLFFLGLFILGKNFAVKTLISSIVYPPVLAVSIRLVNANFLNGFFCIAESNYPEIAILLASLFGGALIGAGCAITFIGGGSTGGTDIIAFIICKYCKKIKSSVMIFIIDALIVVAGMFIINDLVVSMLGILSAFVCALAVDKLFIGESKAFIAHIVSDKYEEINQMIIKRLERTTTIIPVVGGYSKQDKKMIMISFTFQQYSEVINIINICDDKAFVTIQRAHEINGEGWTRPNAEEETQ